MAPEAGRAEGWALLQQDHVKPHSAASTAVALPAMPPPTTKMVWLSGPRLLMIKTRLTYSFVCN